MSATVKTYVFTGVAPGAGAEATKLRFKLADNNTIDTDDTVKIPLSGTRYSYWKSIVLYAESSPDSFINNIKLYSDRFKLVGASRVGANTGFTIFDTGRTSALTHSLAGFGALYKASRQGDFLYFIGFEGQLLDIVDISDFYNPNVVKVAELVRSTCDVGQTATINAYQTFAIDSQYVLALGGTVCFPGEANPRLTIWALDVTDLENITITENYFFNGYAYRFAGVIKGSILYVVMPPSASAGSYFATFDLSTLPTVTILDISNELASALSPALFGEVVVRSSSDHAFISLQKSNRLYIFDVSNPSLLPAFPPSLIITDPRGLALVDDNYLVICQGTENKISIYDVTTPLSPVFVTDLTDAVNLNGAEGITFDGERRFLYISSPSDSRLTAVDVSDISNPAVVGTVKDVSNYTNLYWLEGYSNQPLGWKNCTLHVGNETSSTYAQATGVGLSGDEMVSNHSEITGKTDVFSYTKASPKTISGSIGATTGQISDFVVLQVEVNPSASRGVKNEEALIWQYDEV